MERGKIQKFKRIQKRISLCQSYFLEREAPGGKATMVVSLRRRVAPVRTTPSSSSSAVKIAGGKRATMAESWEEASEYEKLREKRMKENRERMEKLGILDLSSQMSAIKKTLILQKKRIPPMFPHYSQLRRSSRPSVVAQSSVRKVVPTPTELPPEFMQKILQLGGSESDPKMLFQKTLSPTDVYRPNMRLSASADDWTLKLTDAEIADAQRKVGYRFPGFEVKVIDPKLKEWTMPFEKNACVDVYVFAGSWSELVSENGLKQGDVLQFWSFRCKSPRKRKWDQLCFALVKVNCYEVSRLVMG